MTTLPTNTTNETNEIDRADYTRELAVPDHQLTHLIIGAAIEVHRHCGPKLLESVYENAMKIELDHRGIPYRSQVPIPMHYRGVFVGDFYADLIVADRVVVELKAVSRLDNAHLAQMLTYLTVTRIRLGLLMNFNEATLLRGLKRVIRSPSRSPSPSADQALQAAREHGHVEVDQQSHA